VGRRRARSKCGSWSGSLTTLDFMDLGRQTSTPICPSAALGCVNPKLGVFRCILVKPHPCQVVTQTSKLVEIDANATLQQPVSQVLHRWIPSCTSVFRAHCCEPKLTMRSMTHPATKDTPSRSFTLVIGPARVGRRVSTGIFRPVASDAKGRDPKGEED
jgi:hypothetical protein